MKPRNIAIVVFISTLAIYLDLHIWQLQWWVFIVVLSISLSVAIGGGDK